MTVARPTLTHAVSVFFVTAATVAASEPKRNVEGNRERDVSAPARPSTLFRENPPEPGPDERPPPPRLPSEGVQPPKRPGGAPPAGLAPRPASSRRHAVPDPAAQAQSLQLLRDLFADEYRRAEASPAAGKELTDELLRQALQMRGRDTPDDVASRFVLLSEVMSLAAGAQDYATALAAASDLADGYEVDGPAMKLDVIARASRQAVDPAKVEPLVRAVFDVAEETLAAGDLPGASSLLTQADILARKSKSLPLATEVQRRRRELRDLQGQYRNLPDAVARLREAADDEAANLTVGRFKCFVLGDWERGLPMLARAGDAALRSLAERDLRAPGTGDEKAELAEAWWNLADQQSGRAQDQIRSRAAHWYRMALPDLGGLKRTLAQKRIDAAPAPLAAAGPGTPPGSPRPAGPGVVVIERGQSSPNPAPPVGPAQPGDRLLQTLATNLPADLRPVPGERWDAAVAEPFLRRHVRVGAPIAATVKLAYCSGLQRSNSNSAPHAYATFRVVNPVDHNGISHNLDIAVRLEGQKALDLVQTVQGQIGQFSGTIRECRIGGWSGNKERGLSSITFYVMADDIRFAPTDT